MDSNYYVVRFPAPETHYVEIEARLPAELDGPTDLFLAVWTPGSYLVREYARHVEGFEAADAEGRPIQWQKTRKNRWTVGPMENLPGPPLLVVRYRVYCREMSVRTNWVDERFALLQGAASFLTQADRVRRRHKIKLELPEGWGRAVTGLQSSGGENTFIAEDFDELVDAPILAGNPAIYEFVVDGKNHLLANDGEDGLWDSLQVVADLERIVRANLSFWGALPYANFVFLNVIDESGRGGLEHRNSFCILSSRYTTRTRANYVSWLELASHEFFHVWNVKRLRPKALGPFDYENENYTRELWVSEGFTEYYGSLMACRAGVITRDEYLGALSQTIAGLESRPGRRVQTAAESSFDAWIKLYRPDENSGNSSISYYTKGAVIAFLLDAGIREATRGAKCLDDLMRLSFSRFADAQGFTGDELEALAGELAGEAQRGWLHEAVYTPVAFDYSAPFEYFGLAIKAPELSTKSWTGCVTKIDDGRLVVSKVPRETPAFDCGLSVDDEILAIGDLRVKPEQWGQRMEQLRPGDPISLLVARRGRLKRIEIVLAQEPVSDWKLEVVPSPSEAQKARLENWLLPAARL